MVALMVLKKITLLFLLLSASFLSASSAGRASRLVNKLAEEVDGSYDHQEMISSREEDSIIHERLLKVNTKDYGRYDPTPALVRPPFKLIPN